MAKPDPESHLLVAALHDLGIEAELLPWQAECDWSAYPLVVVRTPWDYFRQRQEFLGWARRVESRTRLVNPLAVLHWNSHKAYLRALGAQGIPTVPTLWLAPDAADWAVQLDALDWPVVVAKPAVSIGAIGTLRGAPGEGLMREHVRQLLTEGDVMVQPYLDDIAREGELSLIYFGNRFSHAICKRPRAGDYRVQDMYGGTNVPGSAPAAALQLAEAILPRLPAATAYVRVDVVRQAGTWLLMEVEVIEPELFLPLAPGAAARFAAHLHDLLLSG